MTTAVVGAQGSRGVRYCAAAAGLLLLMLALALLSARDMSITYDETGHLRYGRQLLHGEARRFDDSKMPVSALNALPGVVAAALPPGVLRNALAGLYSARVPTMLAGVVLAWLVWRWSRRLWGERGALLSLLLCAFDPNLLAHARLVTTDVWIALAFAVVLYLFWRLAEEPTAGRGAALAAAFALAQVVKYSAVLLAPLLLLLAAVRWGPEAVAAWRQGERSQVRRRATRLAVGVVIALILTVGVIDAAFLGDRVFTPFGEYRFHSSTLSNAQRELPALAALPVPVAYPYLEGLDWVHHRERTGEGYGRIYLRGELREHGGFPGYYLWAWLYKVPLPAQALLLAALVIAWRRRRQLRWRRDLAVLLLPPLLLAIHLNFFFRAQMGVRYSLLLFPPLYVFAGILAARASWAGLAPRRARLAAGAVAAAGAWLVVSVLSWHPFYISYFNELLRDRRQAWRVLADSNLDWGQNERYIKRWLAAHPRAVLEPPRPQPGTIVVRTNFLVGVLADDRFAWLRRLDPVDQVAYSYLVFEVEPEDLPAAARAATGPAASQPPR
ncbi:MAG TPA: glycosyltransferase family 39 protein [Thermoanaerobaculia bacterium]|nr:glycosyltransferase family 39 protein [Thermoanaerobaculia bacterium]